VRTHLRLFSLALLFTFGCAPAFLIRENRVKYQLEQHDDLMSSTADMHPRNQVPTRTATGVRIFSKVLIQNTSKDLTYQLAIEKAVLSVSGTAMPAKCVANLSQQSQIAANPGSKVLVECSAELSTKDVPTLASRDEFAEFQIPYIAVLYKLKAEDFQR
jgi:hypothetical protein